MNIRTRGLLNYRIGSVSEELRIVIYKTQWSNITYGKEKIASAVYFRKQHYQFQRSDCYITFHIHTTSMDKQQRFNFQKRMKISMPLLCYQTKPKIRIKTHPEIVKNLTSISISRPLTMRSLMNWTLMVAALFSESPMDISDTSSLSIGRGFGSTVQRYSKWIKYVID